MRLEPAHSAEVDQCPALEGGTDEMADGLLELVGVVYIKGQSNGADSGRLNADSTDGMSDGRWAFWNFPSWSVTGMESSIYMGYLNLSAGQVEALRLSSSECDGTGQAWG